jgi:protein-S-isoprenylcysteine O-methyltransferase Ste14
MVIIQAVFLFVCAWDLRWQAGWWYISLYVLMLVIGSLVILPHRSEVIEERSKGAKGGKPWDLRLTRWMMVPSFGLLALAGFDQRWGWTAPLPLWARLLGVLLFILGYAAVLWAMYSNKYFSQVVRIQKERGHATVAEGPYRIVRHPGYLGMTTSMLGAVLILDSIYGLACFAFYLVLIITRTALEDRTLQAELPGYPEYATHTKFRLIPGVW